VLHGPDGETHRGLQESIQQFKKLDEEIELQPILDQLAARPPERSTSSTRA